MDFREMLYITTVADCKSVTAAAKRLYISQPSLSHIISKVEQDVGVQLFDRGTSPITLTYAGEVFVETARKILMMNDNLRKELVDVGLGEKGRICFGMPAERTGYMLPAVIRPFKRQYPRIEIQVKEDKTDELIASLEKDEISFFIAPRNQEELPVGLKTEKIYRERLYLVMSPELLEPEMLVSGEGRDGLRQVDLTKMAHLPFILLKRGHAIRRKADSIFKKNKISPQIMMEVSSCISAVQLADAGLGVTIVPERAVRALGGEERFGCFWYSGEADGWNVNAIYKEEIYLGRMERFLIELMKERFDGTPDGGQDSETDETDTDSETDSETDETGY